MTKAMLYLSILFGSAAFVSCGDSNANIEKKNSHASVKVPVHVQELRLQPFSESLSLSGSIQALDDIKIAPEEGGIVKEWKYKKGAFVPKGAIIVQLDDGVLKPSYDAALAQYKSAELTYEKQRSVYDEQAVSEWQLKTAEYNRDAAKAQAELMQARWERTRIRSSVAGILDEQYIDRGEMAPPGVPIARIVALHQVKVVVNVPERYAGTVKLNAPLSLTVLAYPGETFHGKISYIGSAMSPDNRTFPVEATIPNPELRLKPDMIAKVRINQSVQHQAILVEEDVIQQVDRNKLVVFVENGGRALERKVEIGGRQNGLVEVLSGLKPGERIITRGFHNLVDGQPVEVVQ